ncbi:multidrug resistance protein MdtC [Variibacter gotjawalensis]|uniref:Multidrug resistance protein MdtC n=1 Tax=Variibacter gotjawalensis TaxID=1333996 RepID=A0A0S3PPB2_9BRAD|nr:efflux RND transporter permease subunit [Variibacter gotjawalensis]NIK48061.1 multidrug efflux pump [Variibacter gotjawalensis]RZS49937.1 multidrug efflux pump [Variibacter gotjawalensis]BAT57764.1 multidrug resistance protein MdtC [Variibacter gotjawalensis]
MQAIINYAISHARLTIATLIFLLLAGFVAYRTIPKEAEPDVKVPIIYTQITQRGISPEDSERLLLRPIETKLKSVGNVKEMRSTAFEGGGYVLLEFEAGFDSKSALADVRAKVDEAKRDLPREADEPVVQEVNLSLYPVLVIALAGELPERTLLRIARIAKNAIEQAPGVLQAEMRGGRDEVVEIIAEPMLMKSYGVSLEQLIQATTQSNSLVAAGALEGSSGRFAVKVPALIERPEDVLKIPVAATAGAVVTLGDVAQVRPTFKDATSITRVNGRPAMTIEVSKRTGANLIETVDGVKKVVEQLKKTWPEAVQVSYTQDKSKLIRQMLADLQNSVATGVLLVIVIMLFALGFRASLFIGIAIPASFLAGVLGLQLAGLTVNIVVLFSLILAVGMLVDDAIIVSEYAERRMAEGMPPKEAYSLAAYRMAGPVIAATATRVAAFSPLLFWPGIVGQFMKYLPITLIATLSASLVVALIFTPTLGALLGRASVVPHDERAKDTGPYMRTVKLAVKHPWATLSLAVLLLVSVQFAYGKYGNGVEFFPKVEPDYGLVVIHGRGNLSIAEKDRAIRAVEAEVLKMPGLETVYTRVGEQPRGSQEISEDTIGVIQYEFVDWKQRPAAHVIMDELRQKTAHIAGIEVEVTAPRAGPPTGKPVQVQLSAIDPDALPAAAKKVADMLRARSDIRDLDDGLPLPGIDWKLSVDKAEAAKYGAGVTTVGNVVQLVTNGTKITEFRPSDNDKEVDIIVRFPENRRSLDQIDELRVQTSAGHVPIGNFVQRTAVPRIGYINRVGGNRVMTLQANVPEGVQTAVIQQEIAAELSKGVLGSGVFWKLKGEDEEREKAGAFLMKAFGAAIFLIFAILLAQFNKLTSVGLVLTAVVLSTIGVLLGAMIMGQPFGVVMTGIGIIANAGVIVNNNIVLIDTYDRLRREGVAAYDAIMETCRERARPVVLTAVTAILGVLPIAFGMNIEFLHRELTIGAPATQWWISLSTAIVFGLGFATILTLIVTPAALMAIDNLAQRRIRFMARRAERRAMKQAMATPAE